MRPFLWLIDRDPASYVLGEHIHQVSPEEFDMYSAFNLWIKCMERGSLRRTFCGLNISAPLWGIQVRCFFSRRISDTSLYLAFQAAEAVQKIRSWIFCVAALKKHLILSTLKQKTAFCFQ